MSTSFECPLRGEAAKVVALLPDEMIKYELETQGVKSESHFMKRRKQLSEILESRRYVSGKQPVAMGYREDLSVCSDHLRKWMIDFETSSPDSQALYSFKIKSDFLSRRISRIKVHDDDEEYKTILSSLKVNLFEFRRLINRTSPAVTRRSFVPPVRNIDEWTMREDSMGRSHEPSVPNKLSALHTEDDVASRFNDSILDFSMSFHESDQRDQLHSRTRVIDSTRSGPARNTDPSFIPSSYEPIPFPSPPILRDSDRYFHSKVQIWKWNLKFLGEPDTITVVEFVRRVKELARARRASKKELFDGACDLFDGSALKWFRTGLESGLFRNWDELERKLLTDFKAYDYGDNLWDYIRGRLQKPNERVVIYFAIMEDLFLKLNHPASELVRINTIRRNLRPDILKGLGTTSFQSLNDFKASCKVIEADLRRIQSRESQAPARDPDSTPRRVRFSDSRMNSMADSYESVHELGLASNPSMNVLNNYESEPSDSYYSMPDAQFEENLRELSIRENPSRKIYPVPPAPSRSHVPSQPLYNHPPPGYGSNGTVLPYSNSNQQSSHQPQYYPLQRSLPSNSQAGNASGSQNYRTTSAPTILRRPY